MLSTKSKEHLRRWAALRLPKYGALLGGMAALLAVAAWVGGLLQVVTVTDSHGASATVITASRSASDILAQAGIAPLGRDDELLLTESALGDFRNVHVLRAYTAFITVDGETTEVITTGVNTAEVLAEAGVLLAPEDLVTPAREETVPHGGSITVQRVVYKDYTQEEVVPAQVIQSETSLLYRHTEDMLTAWEGLDGRDLVTYRETWIDGALHSVTELSRQTMSGTVPSIVKVYGEGVPVSAFVGPEVVDGVPVEGVAEVYTGQRATGYSASPTAKGASGRRLTYGTVAVNPSVIPYGSLLYITSDDGRFVYGYAYAADTGTAMMTGHAFIDLYYESYDESVENAVIPVTVYVLDEETAARYQEQNDALLEGDTIPGL